MSQDVRVDEERITARRAQVLNINYLDTTIIQKQLFKGILSLQELYDLRIVPIVADEHYIHFGITTTTSQQTLNNLRKRFSDQRLDFSLISESSYNDYMLLYDPPKKVEYQDINITNEKDAAKKIIDAVSETLGKVRADDMLAYLVQQAYKLKASDIHLENQKENVRVRFRIDGVLHPVAYLDSEKYHHMGSSIASAANVSTDAEDAQTGHISRSYKLATGEEVPINLRVETVPTVLLVSPTCYFKKKTLYSIINTLNTEERKIITLEDPVEYNIPGVVQIPVKGQMEGHDFAEKLRAVLRLDPDVVMVGEIRDQDTAKTALQGALTGHLVLSTFHGANASAALTRMLDMVGINPLFASSMHLIMAQRLVRRLDDSTKQPYKPDDSLKRQLQTVIDTLPPNIPRPDLNTVTLFRPGSSEQNPFGYSGQIAVREQLIMTPGVQELLKLPSNQVTTDMLEKKAIEEGMRTMLHDGILKVLAGQTTLEEVYRVLG
jgi:type II secretory ATPase GspE/PulE/Tfp pilus assembly ATPase PilB-like protein